MKIDNIVPNERLAIFHKWAGPNPKDAFALYRLNLAISESFYTPLSILEVTMRNSINKRMIIDYHEKWITDDEIIVVESQREMVEYCKKKILERQNNSTVENSQFVSNLNLAFWTSMFVRKNEELWRKRLYRIFDADNPINRKYIFKLTTKIRLLRNRISHHKIIIHHDLESDYKNCLKLIGWMSKDALDWCKSQSRFYEVHPGKQIIIDGKFLNPEIDLTEYGAES